MQEQNKSKVTYWLNGKNISKEEFSSLVGEYFKYFDGNNVKAVDYSFIESLFDGDHKTQRQINEHLKDVLGYKKDVPSIDKFVAEYEKKLLEKQKWVEDRITEDLNYINSLYNKEGMSTRHKYSGEGEFHRCPPLSTEEMKKAISNLENRKIGVKETQTVKKAPIFTYCKVNSLALEALAFRALYGHEKYNKNGEDDDWQNFLRVPNAEQEYSNALFRHALNIGKDETEEEHLIASAWNAMARLEVFLRNKNKDLYNSK